jgi:hypothetical protein
MKTALASVLSVLLTAAAAAAQPCVASSTALCLSGGRFEAKVTWTDFQGNSGVGQAVPLTPDTGYFWFFTNTNVELVVKVLDGRALNNAYWVFYGALSNVQYELTVRDSLTGAVQVYDNPSGQFASEGDTSAFPPLGKLVARRSERGPMEPVGRPVDERRVAPSTKHPRAACAASDTALCLNAGRFRVEAAWKDFQGNTGVGHAVGLTGDTGYFWFFGSTNVEAVVKVLDGRALDQSYWVFYGALSDVEYSLTVTDTVTGIVRKYSNPAGLFASVGDTLAFPPPTTLQLIDGAVVKGEISEETALVYKVYALFGDPQLPQAYVGIPPGRLDHGLMRHVLNRWSTLSAATRQLLKAYLAPPIYPGSWFGGGSASAGVKGDRAASDWTKIQTARATVWYRAADPDADKSANNLAAEIENVWTTEANLMKEPKDDGGLDNNGGDTKFDIYVLPSFRDDVAKVKPGQLLQGICVPYFEDVLPTPAYLLIRLSEASTPESARDVLAHEFFHAISDAYTLAGDPDSYAWLDEATATWMEDYVYPKTIDNLEQGYAEQYLSGAFKDSLANPSDGGYAEYLFFFYLKHQFSEYVNASIWNSVGQMSSWEAVQSSVPGDLNSVWSDFALDCWDRPAVDFFKQWDQLSPGLPPEGASPSVVPLSDDGSAKLPLRAVRPLAFIYAYFHTDRDTIKRVGIENQKLTQDSPFARIQAWIRLADGTTRVEDWTKKDRIAFCRDKASEKITDLVIIYSNSNPDPGQQPLVWNDGKLSYDSIGCGYQGTMHVTRHDPDGTFDETIDVTATLVHVPGADFGNTVVYAAAKYTVRYKGIQRINDCTTTIGPVEKTFAGSDVAASVIQFDTGASPPTYSAQAPFFMQAIETEVCPDGTTERTAAAAGLWWDAPPGQQVKPDGSLSGTVVSGPRTYTWSFTPDVGDEGS